MCFYNKKLGPSVRVFDLKLYCVKHTAVFRFLRTPDGVGGSLTSFSYDGTCTTGGCPGAKGIFDLRNNGAV